MTHQDWTLVAVMTICALLIGMGLGYLRGKVKGKDEYSEWGDAVRRKLTDAEAKIKRLEDNERAMLEDKWERS